MSATLRRVPEETRAADEGEHSTSEPAQAREDQPAAPARRRRLPAIAPWVLFGAALAGAIVFAVLWQRAQSANHGRAEVASAASRFLGALTNFRADTIQGDVQEIKSFAVGDFADQVNTFFDQKAVDAIRTSNARSVGRVQSVFVESLSGGTASVFGVVNETVTNSAVTTPRAEVLRIEIEMIDTKGGWKVNRVAILQSPSANPFGGPGG